MRSHSQNTRAATKWRPQKLGPPGRHAPPRATAPGTRIATRAEPAAGGDADSGPRRGHVHGHVSGRAGVAGGAGLPEPGLARPPAAAAVAGGCSRPVPPAGHLRGRSPQARAHPCTAAPAPANRLPARLERSAPEQRPQGGSEGPKLKAVLGGEGLLTRLPRGGSGPGL